MKLAPAGPDVRHLCLLKPHSKRRSNFFQRLNVKDPVFVAQDFCATSPPFLFQILFFSGLYLYFSAHFVACDGQGHWQHSGRANANDLEVVGSNPRPPDAGLFFYK